MGISESQYDPRSITIYPNPCTKSFQIQTDIPRILEVEIISDNGTIVYKQPLEENAPIDVSELVSGVYLVQFSTPRGTITQKLYKM